MNLRRFGLLLAVTASALAGDAVSADPPVPAPGQLIANPVAIELRGNHPTIQLLVDVQTEGGRLVDQTRSVQFRSVDPRIATVSETGVIRGLSDGATKVIAETAGRTVEIPVHVADSAVARRFNFENDVIPILSRFGCNASGCHGKAEGQNGFKLSVFGFDPPADFAALTQEARGRRVHASIPEKSLLLLKASGGVPHGGGVRIDRRSGEYRTLRDWVVAGLPFGEASDPHVVSVEVTPRERQLDPKARQQLRVTATWSDGRKSDVTTHAKFQSNNDGLGTVDESGLVTAGEVPGDVAVMAGYMGSVDVFRALIPRTEKIANDPSPLEQNFIDGLIHQKLRKLNVVPSEPATDADYLRRVFLDVIGTLPTADEARSFLKDSRPDKRARLVEDLLQRPEYADFWALKWADVLRVDRQALGHKRAYAYYRWIREAIAGNMPYDRFCREIVAAEGPLAEVPAGSLFKVVTKPGEMAGTLSQVFLGVRIECAQCHHHPFDRWSQHDYFGMQAFFTQVSFKTGAGGEILLAGTGAATTHPRTGETVFSHALGTETPKGEPAGDRRKLLAAWMASPENPWFARNFVNRIWAHLMGRGLVEPVDDLRLTNPPSNPELLDALAKHFVESKFDVRQLIRTITASAAYQRSATPNPTNEQDSQNYSRALLKRLDAEVLFDAVCDVTGVSEKFDGSAAGYRAIQLWDSQTRHYFLKLFGRPTRVTACECERTAEPSVAQVLHVLNSPEIQAKLTHETGRVAKWTQTIADDGALIEELFLTYYGRPPTDHERTTTINYLKNRASARRQAVEDVAWSLMNTPEFVFNH